MRFFWVRMGRLIRSTYLVVTNPFNFGAQKVKNSKHIYKEKASLRAEDSVAPT